MFPGTDELRKTHHDRPCDLVAVGDGSSNG